MKIHKHHIIPKHAGGTDDESNLIELTIEQHAEAHRLLYEQYGRLEDKRAWLGLSGIMTKEEIIYDILTAPKSESHKLSISKGNKGKPRPYAIGNNYASITKGIPKTENHKEKLRKPKKDKTNYLNNTNGKGNSGKPKSKEHIDKMKLAANKPENKEKKSKAVSDSWNDRPILKCPYCELESKNAANMSRYHFENCKKKGLDNHE